MKILENQHKIFQKHLWSSENSVPIPLTTLSLTSRLLMKTRLSQSEAEEEELNESQSV